jgi:hypothetical protein
MRVAASAVMPWHLHAETIEPETVALDVGKGHWQTNSRPFCSGLTRHPVCQCHWQAGLPTGPSTTLQTFSGLSNGTATFSCTNCTFARNKATYGSAVAAIKLSPTTPFTVDLTGSKFSGAGQRCLWVVPARLATGQGAARVQPGRGPPGS